MKQACIVAIILIFSALEEQKLFSETHGSGNIRLVRLSYLTSNFDSLTRSFIKRGFHIQAGKREPNGVFNNFIPLSDGAQIILETTFSHDSNDWRFLSLNKYGTHVSGITFEVDSINQIYGQLQLRNIPLSKFETIIFRGANGSYQTNFFALDSSMPLDITFVGKDSLTHQSDSLAVHPNHVFRFDWLLLSASFVSESRLRKFFEAIGALKMHEGCCDFWRAGPADDFCFFRFAPVPPKRIKEMQWLSIEPDGIYFAY
jgi:hypothetical protein